MISHFRIIELLVECRVNSPGQHELIQWIRANPKRNLNHVRKVCWEYLSIFNKVAWTLEAGHFRKHSKRELQQIEKLTAFFNTLSEAYPSAKWLGKYRRDCITPESLMD